MARLVPKPLDTWRGECKYMEYRPVWKCLGLCACLSSDAPPTTTVIFLQFNQDDFILSLRVNTLKFSHTSSSKGNLENFPDPFALSMCTPAIKLHDYSSWYSIYSFYHNSEADDYFLANTSKSRNINSRKSTSNSIDLILNF